MSLASKSEISTTARQKVGLGRTKRLGNVLQSRAPNRKRSIFMKTVGRRDVQKATSNRGKCFPRGCVSFYVVTGRPTAGEVRLALRQWRCVPVVAERMIVLHQRPDRSNCGGCNGDHRFPSTPAARRDSWRWKLNSLLRKVIATRWHHLRKHISATRDKQSSRHTAANKTVAASKLLLCLCLSTDRRH